MSNNEILIKKIEELKNKVKENNYLWNEPLQGKDEGNNSIYFAFYGNTSEKEKANLLISYDDCPNFDATAILTKTNKLYTDLYEGYLKYLELNNWLNINTLI